ncbi:hypothetical protein THAOC_04677, partial [Thalassiosira oceanica]
KPAGRSRPSIQLPITLIACSVSMLVYIETSVSMLVYMEVVAVLDHTIGLNCLGFLWTFRDAGDSSRNDKAIDSLLLQDCRVGWKMPSAPATGLSSLKLGLDSTPQSSLRLGTPTEVDPIYVEKRDNFEIASAGTQCR